MRVITIPDGVEVVAGSTEARSDPLLIIDRVTEFLDARNLGRGPIAWTRVGNGQSNVTYRIRRGGEDFILRRGPRPPHPPSAHDMVREAMILQALRPQGVAVPEVLAICDDAAVLGVPFYVMEWLDGYVVTGAVPPALSGADGGRRISRTLVEALARLHQVDTTIPTIAALGRGDGYLTRQISRFSHLWQLNTGRALTEVEELASWLQAAMPATQQLCVVHGDYRLGNIMLRRGASAEVQAILDWEMAALGDPLSDLGYLIAGYSEAGAPVNPLHMSPCTAEPGFLRREELVELYAELTGFDVTSLRWYHVLALWKAAVFCEAIYGRWTRGERPDDSFGPTLAAGVPALLDEAISLTY